MSAFQGEEDSKAMAWRRQCLEANWGLERDAGAFAAHLKELEFDPTDDGSL